jgi:hypothetical protein
MKSSTISLQIVYNAAIKYEWCARRIGQLCLKKDDVKPKMLSLKFPLPSLPLPHLPYLFLSSPVVVTYVKHVTLQLP